MIEKLSNKYVETLRNLIVYQPINKKIRLGKLYDGGYIIIDDYNYDCFLSAGLGEVSFEIDFIKKNPNIFSAGFDNTCETLNFPAEMIKVKKNIGVVSNEITTNLKEYAEKYNDIFIKMDIEGEEWNWIKAFQDYFPKVKQFVFEGHAFFPHMLGWHHTANHCKDISPDVWVDNILESLKILNNTHYLVHIHENNQGPLVDFIHNKYPSFFELTFIRKDCEICGTNTDNLPISIDSPVWGAGTIEHNMNFWPFKF